MHQAYVIVVRLSICECSTSGMRKMDGLITFAPGLHSTYIQSLIREDWQFLAPLETRVWTPDNGTVLPPTTQHDHCDGILVPLETNDAIALVSFHFSSRNNICQSCEKLKRFQTLWGQIFTRICVKFCFGGRKKTCVHIFYMTGAIFNCRCWPLKMYLFRHTFIEAKRSSKISKDCTLQPLSKKNRTANDFLFII